MAEESITNLPPEIIIDILSGLPIRTVTTSKYVCKPWLDLIETPEFAKSHLSKSVPGVIVGQCQTRRIKYTTFTILDFEEAIKKELEPHHHGYSKIAEIKFLVNPQPSLSIQGSANGLLFFRLCNTLSHSLYICNPILRHYIQLPISPKMIVKDHTKVDIYGFGVSKIKDEYKAVRIVVQSEHSECEVYTLGTRTWRRVPCGVSFKTNWRSVGTFHNGKLHWFVPDLDGCLREITSFDLETETFSTFSPSPPPLPGPGTKSYVGAPRVFDGCLCLCHHPCYDEIDIWMMKNECWRKEFRISKHPDLVGPSFQYSYPLMPLRDGDVLMTSGGHHLFYYSGKNRTTKVFNMFERDDCYTVVMPHTSSFVSLKRFIMENVSSF